MSSNRNPFIKFKNVRASATSGMVIGQVSQDRRRMDLVPLPTALAQAGVGPAGFDYFNPGTNNFPSIGSFTYTDNHTAATHTTFAHYDNNGDGLVLDISPSDITPGSWHAPDNGATILMAESTYPSTPWTRSMLFSWTGASMLYWLAGIFVKDSSAGSIESFGITGSGYAHQGWTTIGNTNFNVVNPISGGSGAGLSTPTWVRLTDDGTNFLAYASCDGRVFDLFFKISRTNFLTTPDKMGIIFSVLGVQNYQFLKGRIKVWDYQ